jgi:UDP-N-acetylglucosamine 1-carboxyvinyltransferase
MLEVARIIGGHRLSGTIQAAGAKNAALPLLAASLLTSEAVTLHNVPDLSDVRFMAEILRHQGAIVTNPTPGTWVIHAQEITHRTPYDLVRKMRASVCLLGALVGRLHQAEMAIPGGCVIGPRPIDLHLKGLEALGCVVAVEGGVVSVDATRTRGGLVFMGGPMGSTVLGTANLVMAAALTPGETRIECAAREPEVVDLCELLLKMGADIRGHGTAVITIKGVERLRGTEHTVIPDRIETGTYLVAGAITDGDVTVTGAEAAHLGAFLDKLRAAGVGVETGPGFIRAFGRPTRAVDIITEPYPGFPTDLQAQFMALQLLVDGRSTVTETVYPHRFMHAAELQRMGAEIAIDGATAAVYGDRPLSGAPVMASDLRASAALILAALTAKGETWVQRLYHLDRGYERFEERLRSLGADIERLPASTMPKGFAED